MGRVLLILAILLALVLAVFGVQNPQPVIIQFLNVQTSFVPLYVVILVSALAGILLSIVAGLRGRIAQSMRVRKLERRVAELEGAGREVIGDHRRRTRRTRDGNDTGDPLGSATNTAVSTYNRSESYQT